MLNSILIFLFTLIASRVDAQELKRITMGYPSLAFTQSHIWVGKEQGLFRKYGVDVDPVFLRGGQVATQALAAGEPPMVNVGTVIQANLSGYNVVLVASMENKFYQLVFVRPGIASLEQLKGQEAGDQRLRLDHSLCGADSRSSISISKINKDLILVPGGPDAERLGSMSAGTVDASFFNLSTAPIARKMGFVDLLQIADLGVEVQGNGLATSRAYLKSNRDTVKNVMKGYLESIHFIYARKPESQKVFAKYMRTNDPEVLETFLSKLREDDSKKADLHPERHSIYSRHAGAADAAGEDGEAGAVFRCRA